MSDVVAVVATIRLIHPAPAATVVALSAALGAILRRRPGLDPGWRLALTTLAVAGSQIMTGALNDWADRDRDRVAQPSKPIPSGAVSPGVALWSRSRGGAAARRVAAVGGRSRCCSARRHRPRRWPTTCGCRARRSRCVPYLVSFGLLPLWVAAGVGVDLARVAAAPLIVGPFAAAAHLANTLRDFDGDARLESRNLAQILGRATAFRLAWGWRWAVGWSSGAALLAGGPVAPASVGLGLVGLVAVGQGVVGAQRLWGGMLVAAVCWTAAWALATA